MIYFFQIEGNGPIKIGYTTSDVKIRMTTVQSSVPYKLNLLGYFSGGWYKEQEIHRKFSKFRMRGEWFRPSKKILQYLEQEMKRIGQESGPGLRETLHEFSLGIPEHEFVMIRGLAAERGISQREVARRFISFCLSDKTKAGRVLDCSE